MATQAALFPFEDTRRRPPRHTAPGNYSARGFGRFPLGRGTENACQGGPQLRAAIRFWRTPIRTAPRNRAGTQSDLPRYHRRVCYGPGEVGLGGSLQRSHERGSPKPTFGSISMAGYSLYQSVVPSRRFHGTCLGASRQRNLPLYVCRPDKRASLWPQLATPPTRHSRLPNVTFQPNDESAASCRDPRSLCCLCGMLLAWLPSSCTADPVQRRRGFRGWRPRSPATGSKR